jgi:hypothetical protein
LLQTGHRERALGLVTQLKTSDSPNPADTALLKRLSDPPALVFGLRLRALLTLLILAVAALGTCWWLRKRCRKACRRGLVSQASSEYDVDQRDILSGLAARWLRLSPGCTFLLGLVFIGGGMAALAWSEDVLWASGYVVDRAFMDYLSFPYGFGLLIPAFLAGTLLLYRLAHIIHDC